MRSVATAASVTAVAALAACATPGCAVDEPQARAGDAGAATRGVNADVGTVLGTGKGKLVELYVPREGLHATALAWNPEFTGELWVTFRQTYDGSPCNEPLPSDTRADPACAALAGTLAVLTDADRGSAPPVRLLHDFNAWHFLRLPSALAFGDNGYFATSGEARTGNYDDAPAAFMGPTLWSADPDQFDDPGDNGSHLDMLHASPYAVGIAHERDNVYWVVNGNVGALDRYDFRLPHEPGGADHSDGEATRFIEGELERVPSVPSHVVYDRAAHALYVADTGHGRVLRVDADSGRTDGTEPTDDDQMPAVTLRVDVDVAEIVPPGNLEAPSGLALANGTLYVTDNATSRIVAFDTAGKELGAFDTGLPEGTLAGIAIGPDGKAYLADSREGVVRRVEPTNNPE